MRIEQQITIHAEPDAVWEQVCDPLAIARAVGPAMTVIPDDPERDCEKRARYRVLIHVGAALVGGDVEVVEHARPRELAWTSITGVSHRFRIRLRPVRGGDGTRVTLRFAYDAPGVLGSVADVAAFPRLRRLLDDALSTMKHLVEEGEPPPPPGPSPAERAVREVGNVGVLARAGIVRPMRPDKLARMALAARHWGPSLGAAVAATALRHPDRDLLHDEDGPITYGDVDRRADAVAFGLRVRGVEPGDAVGLLARNHRGFVIAATAIARCGADVLLLNTGFAAPQVGEVCEREGVTLVIHDEEFEGLLAEVPDDVPRVLADGDRAEDSLVSLALEHVGERPPAPGRAGRVTILTSGTTGTPKGASRGAASSDGGGGLAALSLDVPAGILERIPMRAGMRVGLVAPMFHAWGLGNLALGLALGATLTVTRKFSPEQWLELIDREDLEALIVVPVMLQRLLAVDEEVRARYDTSSLRVVSASGSALPGELATTWMDTFGDNLHNLYGSTEVAQATIATPRDLRAAPGTAGRPTRGTVVKLLDEHGAEVPQGTTGRIFVGSAATFEGYTGGADKDRIGGLVSSGDVGRFDEAGRLFVEGRDDEMIVSGGENVFPKEVEDTLAGHPAVDEAACVGVDDEQFGQRLHAFVVLRSGKSVTEDALKKHVKAKLAGYKVPRAVTFLDELPRNATGKVLKRELVAED